MKKIIVCILSLTLLFCGCTKMPEESNNEPVNALYIKSVWMSYYELGNITTNCDSAKEFEKAIKTAFKRIKSFGLNTVTVQVRPCADAFYKSDYFPTSKYCFGEEGCDLKYDPLKIMVDVAHKLGIRIEAWLNPYRVSQSSKISELSENNIAKKWYNSDDKKSNVFVGDKIYFNPASSEVNELIVNGVKEIVSNYAIDAIHFDDYFYPTKEKSIDEAEYKSYVDNGGKLSLDNWRRENVSNMIKSVYSAIKEINSFVQFGVSPQSKISTDYNDLYADVEKWISEDGYVDYICPQIYFGFHNEIQPFTKTVKKWSDITKSSKLHVGLALYKSGKEDKFASEDKSYAINEFVENSDIISRQISYLYQIENVTGFYIFSYNYLVEEKSDTLTKEVENIKNVI